MNPRAYRFQLNGVRGLPAVLPLLFMAVLAIGVIALLVFVGLAVAVVGLSVSACAALYYAIRRKLTGHSRPSPLRDQVHRENPSHQNVKVIEVEAVRVDRD